MKYSLPGLGGRIRRARNGTALSQATLAEKIGVSWMTVHRWERSERGIQDYHLDRICELADRSAVWFLTMEVGDMEEADVPSSAPAAARLAGKIADAPESVRPLIERVVEDMLDSLKRID